MPSTLENNTTSYAGENLTAFEPTGARADFLDRRMRHELAESLRHIFAQANGQLAVPEASIQRFLSRVEAAPVSPVVFSLYCDAVLAIEDDDLGEASTLLTELVEFPVDAGGLAILDLPDPEKDAAARRLVRFIDTDPSLTLEIFAPPPDVAANCRRLIQGALALMDAGDPDQSAEIRALLRQIVLAAGSLDPKAMTFDGASSFMLWGGIIINANQRDSELVMAQMLVHECSHNLLFGLCAHEALVENEDDELYPSPLRADLRPMDGIYHATFVTARMHRVVKRLLDSGTLSTAMAEKARKELLDNARLFAGGIATVQKHGRLTPLGKVVMQGARDYMAGAS